MEMNGKTIKLVLGSFLVMTSISMGKVTCEQWFSKASMVFVAHTFLKHTFFNIFDPKQNMNNWTEISGKLKLNCKEIKLDFHWKCVWVSTLVWLIKICHGTPRSTALAEILTELSLILIALSMVRFLRLHRNHCQDIRLLKKSSLAPDSARTTFSFLENIIKGKKETMKKRLSTSLKNKSFFEQIFEEHFEREKIKKVPPHPKLVLLFPEGRQEQENGHALGSVEDILHKEKEEGSEHILTREKISYQYEASSGMHRTAQLEVLKIIINGDTIYMAIAEIRGLKTFYNMLAEPCIDFRSGSLSGVFLFDIPRWENFQMQFHIYRRELARLLDEDEGCRGR